MITEQWIDGQGFAPDQYLKRDGVLSVLESCLAIWEGGMGRSDLSPLTMVTLWFRHSKGSPQFICGSFIFTGRAMTGLAVEWSSQMFTATTDYDDLHIEYAANHDKMFRALKARKDLAMVRGHTYIIGGSSVRPAGTVGRLFRMQEATDIEVRPAPVRLEQQPLTSAEIRADWEIRREWGEEVYNAQ